MSGEDERRGRSEDGELIRRERSDFTSVARSFLFASFSFKREGFVFPLPSLKFKLREPIFGTRNREGYF